MTNTTEEISMINTTETRCYVYGLLDPVQSEPVIDQQVAGAHRYRNTLTEIERDRRAAVREVLSTHADTAPDEARLVDLKRQHDEARDAVRRQRSQTRRRSESAEARAHVRQLGAQVKELKAKIHAAKTAVREDPVVVTARAAIATRAHGRGIDARAACGVYWGTYQLIEDDAQRARKSSVTPPEFKRWYGSGRWCPTDGDPAWLANGRVSVQLQGGLSVEDLWGGNTQLQIDRVPDEAWLPETSRGDRRRLGRTRIRLRVASDGRDPVWAEWPMIMHRPLPTGAIVTRATVSRRAVDCRRWRWSVQLTLSIPSARRPIPSAGTCAINPGWRITNRGLRVGYVMGNDGYEEEIIMPVSVVKRLRKADGIHSVRDRHRNEMRATLAEWLNAYPSLPPWIVERSSHLVQWRSLDRFRGLAMAWGNRRFDGDSIGHSLIEAWRYRDEHLERFEAGVIRGALGHRREAYRAIASRLAARYRVVVVDDTDYREMQRSPATESEQVEIPAVKWNQRAAAPSLLRLAAVSTFGSRTSKLACEGITETCYGCGTVDKWDHSIEIEHTCSGCGQRWDQDANACRNLLRREQQRVDADRATARTAKPRESKWSRLKREAAVRRAATADADARE